MTRTDESDNVVLGPDGQWLAQPDESGRPPQLNDVQAGVDRMRAQIEAERAAGRCADPAMSSGSIPDPHRWMDVACTCTFPAWAHEDHCKRGQAIRDYCDEGIRRERDVNDQPDTTAPQPDARGVLLMQHGIALNALRTIYALPCQHPDNPDEDRLLARQFAEAQKLAGDALGAVDA